MYNGLQRYLEPTMRNRHWHVATLTTDEVQWPVVAVYHHLLAVHSGEVLFKREFEAVQLQAGSLAYVAAGTLCQSLRALSPNTRVSILRVDPHFLDGMKGFEVAWKEKAFMWNRFDLPVCTAESSDLMWVLLHHLQHAALRNSAAESSVLYLLFDRLQSLLPGRAESAITQAHYYHFRQFLDLLEQHFERHLSIEEYAEKMHISSKSLSRALVAITGKSFTALHQSRNIKEAQRLLAFTHQNIQEVSERVGFNDPSYFTKIFVKHSGCTPQEFRKTMKLGKAVASEQVQ
jgi:AraC-like DNA-binding protein